MLDGNGLEAGFTQFLLQFRDGCEQVGHEAVIGNLENRRLFILVDGDNDLESFMPARC